MRLQKKKKRSCRGGGSRAAATKTFSRTNDSNRHTILLRIPIMINYRLLRIIVFSVLIIYGCSASNEAPKQNHSGDLIVIQGARDVKYANLHGTEQVSYRVSMAYPATKALSDIYERLKARGWVPLEEDYLNPGHPSSHVLGWGSFTDGTKRGNPWIHQWLAQWKNNNRDILWYALRYESGDKKGLLIENLNLQIEGIFVPASLAEAEREEILKKKSPSCKESKP